MRSNFVAKAERVCSVCFCTCPEEKPTIGKAKATACQNKSFLVCFISFYISLLKLKEIVLLNKQSLGLLRLQQYHELDQLLLNLPNGSDSFI
jgi:hypothetical protein